LTIYLGLLNNKFSNKNIWWVLPIWNKNLFPKSFKVALPPNAFYGRLTQNKKYFFFLAMQIAKTKIKIDLTLITYFAIKRTRYKKQLNKTKNEINKNFVFQKTNYISNLHKVAKKKKKNKNNKEKKNKRTNLGESI
jgi:hypothetical protein